MRGLSGATSALYDAYFEERDLIPDNQFHEIRFEDLERDPVAQTRGLYESLGIPDSRSSGPRSKTT